MKILHTEASCGWGGQEIRILEESRGLIERGHAVTLACPAHARIAEEAGRYGVPAVHLPIEFRSIAGFFAVRRLLAASGYEVVNTHSSADSWLAALACATLSKPPAIVRTRHISAPVSGNFANRWLYRQAQAVVTTGEALREDLIARVGLPADKAVSVPTGIDTQRFSPPADKAAAKKALGLDPSVLHIGIVATLRSWKGHLYLLEALSRIPKPELRLVIVGAGPYREVIESKARELGLHDRAVLTGQRQDPENWLRAFDLFCLPSYANEGVPQVLMQAMSTGLPVIGTPVGSISEIVDDNRNGLLVPPRNIPELAQAITRLLNDPELALRLGAAAREEAIRRFGFDTMIDRMESVFRKAVVEWA